MAEQHREDGQVTCAGPLRRTTGLFVWRRELPPCDPDVDMDFDFDSWDDPTDVCGACGFGGQVACAPDCPEFLYQLQLAAEQEAEQEARAAFWRLWKSPVVLLT